MKSKPTSGPPVPPVLAFAISFPATSSREPLDGRLLLLVSRDNSKEPRFQINEDLNTQQVFGVDVDGLKPGQEATVDASAFGYPLVSLASLKPGEYWVQALLHVYETFKRAGRPHREAADGPRRRSAVEQRARKSLQHAAKINDTANDGRAIKIAARQSYSANRTAKGYEVHQARADAERVADEVLGPADVSRRECSAA